MRIFAHRGNRIGKQKDQENKLESLIEAFDMGFDIEFDINLDTNSDTLILSHDPDICNKSKSPSVLMEKTPSTAFSALNVKSLYSVIEVLNLLRTTNRIDNYFLFDFELLQGRIKDKRFLMKSVQAAGFSVAYRLSDKENYLKEYMKDESVRIIWLDEFEKFWVDENVITLLKKNDKKTFYVSPELHGCEDFELIKNKWKNLHRAGVTGICTDYPEELNKIIGEGYDKSNHI